MRKIYVSLFIICLLSQGWSAYAQQVPMTSLYRENRFTINPANAGYSDGLVGFINYRNQWSGLKNSPTTGWLSLHTPVGKNSNIGTNIVYDKTSFISNINAMVAYAHDITLADDHELSLGVGIGVNHTQLDLTDAIVESQTDPLLNFDYTTELP